MLADSARAVSYHPAWDSLPAFLWTGLILLLVLLFRHELHSLFRVLERRVRQGAGVKVGAIEIAQVYVPPGGIGSKHVSPGTVRNDDEGRRHAQREEYYLPNRSLMLVHRIAPSMNEGQLYDVLLYVVPNPTSDGSLLGLRPQRPHLEVDVA